jgi:hypothetical protein
MQTLDLSLNLLSEIENETFTGLQNLFYLNLSSNKIETISSDGFKIMRKLLNLDLSLNKIKIIEDFTFQTLNLLNFLNLNGNDINSIPNNKTLNGLFALRNLWIRHDLLRNKSNINNIIEAMHKKSIMRTVNKIEFYSSLEIITDKENMPLSEIECLEIIDLLLFNIHINLYNQERVSHFLNECSIYHLFI